MAISFLHAADIHLDSPLKGLERYENAPLERIRGATRRAFTRLIDLAIDKRVDFVLLAGDLYDGDWRDYNTGLFLVGQLGRLRDHKIPVFLIAGNHDAANKMTRVLRLPDNVRLLAHDRPETVRLDDLDVAIHGQSFAKAAVTENLAADYPAPVSGCINIGLLHTGMGGENGHERYAPCTLEELRLRGYRLLGPGSCPHPPGPVRGPSGHLCRQRPRPAYPRNRAQRCLISTIDSDRSIAHVFHRLDKVRWERERVDVSLLETESDVLGRTAELFDGLLAAEPDPECMLAIRVSLSGATPLHGRLRTDPERFVAEVRGLATERGGDRLWIEKVELQTKPLRTASIPDGPFEELVEVLEQLRDDPGSMTAVVEELAELKRKLPAELIHDPDSPRLDDPEWLRTLLGQVQPLLLDLLLKSASGDTRARCEMMSI